MAMVTVSVLFTDLVGSTEFSARFGPETADETRREHFGLLRAAFSAHGGVEVKTGGDGLMVVFGAAVDALAGAVAAQQTIALRNRRADQPLEMRVGVSAGDVELDEGDYFGMPVVEAARLCAVATAGQILASDLVRSLAGSRGGYDFGARGERSLKGLPDPVGVVEVRWTALHDVSALPSRLAVELERSPVFVGRVGELEQLRDAWKRAVSGSRQALMLVGEPGIGKTRLAAQLAAEVHTAGGWVLYGRSDEVAGLPYQVFVEGLARVVAEAPVEVLRQAVERGGSDVGRIAPGLSERLSGLAEPPRLDAESERYRLFEAVAALLASLAGYAPVLIVLDDLHWADEPSLLLLRHLLRMVDLGPVAVVATYRDTDLVRTHPLASMLPDLLREPDVARISLDGLTLDEVAVLATDAGAPGLAERIHNETRGNPLFVREVLLDLDSMALSAVIRFISIDDHPTISDAVGTAAKDFDDLEMVANFSSISAVPKPMRTPGAFAEVALLDLSLPGPIGWLEAVETVVSWGFLVLVFSGNSHQRIAQQVIAAGAHGFVGKSVETVQVLEAIRAVARGECPMVGCTVTRGPIVDLTPAEEQLLEMLPEETRSAELAHRVGVTAGAIDNRITELYDKVGLIDHDRTRARLGVWARDNGFAMS